MRWSTMKDLRNFAKPALILLTVAKKMASQEARRLHRTVTFAKAPLGVQLLKQLPPPCVLSLATLRFIDINYLLIDKNKKETEKPSSIWT